MATMDIKKISLLTIVCIVCISLFSFNVFSVSKVEKELHLNQSEDVLGAKEKKVITKYDESLGGLGDRKTSVTRRIYRHNANFEIQEKSHAKIAKDNVETLTKNFIANNKDLLKVEVSGLKLRKTEYDKPIRSEHKEGVWYVFYQQYYNDILVYGSYVGVVWINGEIVKISSNFYPNISIITLPTLSENDAFEVVKKNLSVDTIRAKEISLVVFPIEAKSSIEYRLAWQVELPLIENPFGSWVYFIDAHDGEIIHRYNRIIFDSISGVVTGMIYPEHPNQSQIRINFSNETIYIKQGGVVIANTTTNSSGRYILSGLSGTVEVYAELKGPNVNVLNADQARASHSYTLSVPSTHDWNWNESDTSAQDEESNMFYHVNLVHDYFTAGSPFNITAMNYQMNATVEYGTDYCSAFYSAPNMYFGNSSSCGNLALMSDVIYHEYTHAVVDNVYVSSLPYSDQTGAMNEGWADYFATTINNNSCLSEGFMGDLCLRNVDNTYRYPEDWAGEVHDDSRMFSGALWDIRTVLGANATDDLTMRAMKLEAHSFSEYLDDVLTVDDDNGDLSDGTPNRDKLCQAFYKNHGIYSPYCAEYYYQSKAYSNTTDVSIPDNDGWVWSSITVPTADNGTIKDVLVYVGINHTYIGDLKVNLTAPDGTTASLHKMTGVGTDNIYTWYYNETVPANKTGLRSLVNKSSAGTWVLNVSDNFPVDVGFIDTWTLLLYLKDTISPSISVSYATPLEKGSTSNITIMITELRADTYKVYKNGTQVANGSYTNGVPFNVSTDTTQVTLWNYTIWANDTAGNSNFTSVFITVQDTIPPTITIHSPANATISDNTPLLNVTFGEVVNYTWYNVDGGANSSFFAETQNLTLNLSVLVDGPHNVTVYANDSVGNLNSSNVNFTVDTTSPNISAINPSPAEKGSQVNLTIIITEPHPDTYKVYKNDSLATGGGYGDGVPFNITIDASQVTLWNYTIWANDTVGNINQTLVLITIQDTTPPRITIHSPANKTTNVNTPLLNATFGEVVNHTWYNVDGMANSTPFTDTQNLTVTLPALSDGQHSIIVYANDSVGNANYTTVYFTVDVTPPSVKNLTITSRFPELNSLVNITVNVTDATTSVDTVRANVTYPNGTTITLAMQPGSLYYRDDFNASVFGGYNVTIFANDSAGNINSTVRTSFYTVITNNNATNVTNGSTASVLSIFEHLDLLVTANESLNATISLSASVSPTADVFSADEINSSNSALERPVKYVNATNLTVIENISTITLRVYYSADEISGLNEDSLALLYWNGSRWLRVADYVGGGIPGGPNVTAAGLDKSNKFVYAELNRLSVYGIGGNVQVQQQQQIVSAGGGGGGGGGLVCIVEGFQVLDLGLMGCIVKDLGLTAKLFSRVANTLAPVFSMVGDVVGEWPAPRLDISSIITRPIKSLEGDVYELAVARVQKRWPSAPAVVIARGDLEVDSIAAIAYAKVRNYPILLTKPDTLPSVVLKQVKSMDVKKIIIAGGPVAVSKDVESHLSAVAPVERIAGRNREETAVELAKAMEPYRVIDTIVVADGLNAAPEATIVAAGYRAPIVFVAGDNLPQATKDFLVDHKVTKDAFKKKMKFVFVGVSDKAKAEIEALMR